MRGFRAVRVGAVLLGAAGIFWAVYTALAYRDGNEALKCGSVGLGFALVAWSLWAPESRRLALLLGLTVAALGTSSWWASPLARGSLSLGWGLFALGLAVAAVVALGAAARSSVSASGFRIAFALVALATLRLIFSGGEAAWMASYVAALGGAILLVVEPPAVPARRGSLPGAQVD